MAAPVVTVLLALLACSSPASVTTATTDSGETVPADVWVVPLDDARLLRRLSIDLRGVLPTVSELDSVDADPSQLTALRDSMLEDDRLEGQLVSMLAERYLTRLDEFQVDHSDYHLEDDQECSYERAVGEEPLRLIARVVTEGRPWTDIVTQSHTVANETLAEVWPLELTDDPATALDGWADAVYTDGRPAGGVLVSNGLWWRYVTSLSNSNRSRAAAISNLLLCDDILARPVSFADTPALTDEAATLEALRSNEYCLGCHSHVDPVAAALFGFYPSIDYNPEELGFYHPEREPLGEDVLGVSPAWFGTPIQGLIDLGLHVATDPRFARCGVETWAALLWRRPVELSDHDAIDALRVGFLDQDLVARDLLAAITDTDSYQAGATAAGAPDDVVEREQTRRMMTPDQLNTAVADLTGFTWTESGCEQLANDDLGYRILAGGVDGDMVVRPQQEPGLTWALTVKRLAQAAALHVVEAELEEAELEEAELEATDAEARLLTMVTIESRPGDEALRAQLAELVWRAHAVRASDSELDELEALWQAVFEVDSVDGEAAASAQAWVAVLSSLLRDPAFLSY